jgi:hypothetical protein
MQITGYSLTWLGIALIIAQALVWLGIIKLPAPPKSSGDKNVWDFLIELVRQQLWGAAVGLILIYFGLRTLGWVP